MYMTDVQALTFKIFESIIVDGYMCILLYMTAIWCNGFPEIYAQLEEVGSISHGYMCMLLYTKLMQCNGFPKIYA